MPQPPLSSGERGAKPELEDTENPALTAKCGD
jgi:hypothetical protein